MCPRISNRDLNPVFKAPEQLPKVFNPVEVPLQASEKSHYDNKIPDSYPELGYEFSYSLASDAINEE